MEPPTRPAPAAGPIKIVVATQFPTDQVDRLRAVPGVEVHFDPSFFAAQRFASDPYGVPGFRRTDDQQDRFARDLASAEVVMGIPDASIGGLAGLLELAPGLRWVQGMPAGTGEAVRRAQLSARQLAQVSFTSGAGVHAVALAEWALFGLLAFTKDLPSVLEDRAAHRWEQRPAREVAGSTMVVLGLGEIGRRIAVLGDALGAQVIGLRRTSPSHGGGPGLPPGVSRMATADQLPQLLRDADSVMMSLPGTVETAGFLSADLIAALPERAIVVNVGRGTTIDEPALIEALQARRVRGAALDVFATEPLPAESPLWDMPNVLISPHAAAMSERQDERRMDLMVDNLRRYVEGRPLRNLVDTVHFY
jgi:phosphoglycerate dehydrogenase-like enzyme